MATPIITGNLLGNAGVPGVIYTAIRQTLRTVVAGLDAVGGFAEFIFLAGVASTVVGSVVVFDDSGNTVLLTAGANGPVAVALTANISATGYAWYGLSGVFPTKVAANCADNAKLGREGADGSVGDGFSAGDQLVNAISRAATTSAAVVNCEFSRAFCGINVA